MKKSIRFISIVLAIVVFSLFAIGSGSSKKDETTTSYAWSEENNEDSSKSNEIKEVKISEVSIEESTTKEEKKSFTLGDTFTFDEFELTIGNTIKTTTVDNKYSDHYGETVIVVPITVKNIGSETGKINMFYIKYFGSKGTKVSGLSSYFDNSIEHSGDMRPGASMDVFAYIPYDGDGVYGIDFDNYSDTKTVEFKVAK